MRTTISLPDELFAEAKALAEGRTFSDFASEAIGIQVAQLKRDRLALQMENGYHSEAESPSLASEWSVLEAEGL
jgi:hypothetical protein